MSDTDTPRGYGDLKQLASSLRRALKTLHVLDAKNDPYMVEMPYRLEAARWFEGLYNRLKVRLGIHVRQIFYLLVSQPTPVLQANGEPFENTVECSQHLAKAATPPAPPPPPLVKPALRAPPAQPR